METKYWYHGSCDSRSSHLLLKKWKAIADFINVGITSVHSSDSWRVHKVVLILYQYLILPFHQLLDCCAIEYCELINLFFDRFYLSDQWTRLRKSTQLVLKPRVTIYNNALYKRISKDVSYKITPNFAISLFNFGDIIFYHKFLPYIFKTNRFHILLKF